MSKRPVVDPSEVANQKILDGIRERAEEKEAARVLAYDLGLDLKKPKKGAKNAVDFLADEFDRKTFGDPVPTYTKVIYGPHPYLENYPQMKASIERIGLEAFAECAYEAILTQKEKVVPDPLMQRALKNAIRQFSPEDVATAFKKKIMEIPQRTIEIEAERNDAMIFAKPLEEAVMKYGTPGMSPKFLSPRCIDQLGMRDYVIVKNEKGDPVKVGTLIMGEIPEALAEKRRQFYARESQQKLADAEDEYRANIDRTGRAVPNFSGALRPNEVVFSQGAGNVYRKGKDGAQVLDEAATEAYLGQERAAGFTLEKQR